MTEHYEIKTDYEISYRDEWIQLFSSSRYLLKLKQLAIQGHLKKTRVRSICWKVLLGCLPETRDQWIEKTKYQRKQYDDILEKSPWNHHSQEHDELKNAIQQDVLRTFPDMGFFKSSDIQNMMINILFNYACEYPRIAFKQGMSELLAPILYVLHFDQQCYLHASEASDLDMDIADILLNRKYLEHDCFMLFSRLMQRVKAWYTMDSEDTSEEQPKKLNLVCFLSLEDTLKSIYCCHLKRIDNELFCHLNKLEITPQMYGIRWLRLLFLREFSITDLLFLWDAIFADNIDFLLVDYLFVAMLNALRGQLLEGDFASCLYSLMRFPHVDVRYVIDLALHLMDSRKYRRPEGGPFPTKQKPTKQIEYKSLPKTSAGSIEAPNHSKESHPKSLSIVGANKLRSNAAESGGCSKSSNLKESHANVVPFVENEPDRSSDVLSVALSSNLNIGASSTHPRTSICNIMEFQAADLSQMLGHESNEGRNLQEFKHPKDDTEEIMMLKTEVLSLKSMNEYCSQQMTLELNRLEECLMSQKLENKDELFISLASLKRARDVLNGTLNFNDEFINEGIVPQTT